MFRFPPLPNPWFAGCPSRLHRRFRLATPSISPGSTALPPLLSSAYPSLSSSSPASMVVPSTTTSPAPVDPSLRCAAWRSCDHCCRRWDPGPQRRNSGVRRKKKAIAQTPSSPPLSQCCCSALRRAVLAFRARLRQHARLVSSGASRAPPAIAVQSRASPAKSAEAGALPANSSRRENPPRCIRPPQPLASAPCSSVRGLAGDPRPPCASMPRPRRARRLRYRLRRRGRSHGVGLP